MRGLLDTAGEQFAYLEGNVLYTLEGEPTGRLEGNHIVDLAGNPVWRVIGDGVYSLNGAKSIGYFTGEVPDRFSR